MKRLLSVLLMMMSGIVLAHDPGISNATVELGASPLTIRLTFALTDLLIAGVDGSDAAQLHDAATKAVEWHTGSGPASIQVRSAKAIDATTAEFVLELPRVPGEYRSLLLPDMPLGHRQLLILRDHAGEAYRIQMLNAHSPGEVVSQHDLDRTAPPAPVIVMPRQEPVHGLPWVIVGLVGIAGLGVVPLLRRGGKVMAAR